MTGASSARRPTGPTGDRRGPRACVSVVLALLPFAIVTSACSRRGAEPVARNVLLIVIDTLRADRLGCYGYDRDTSPNIDALARGGTLYTDARCQGSWTAPSMLSMMSGLYVTEEEQRLPATVPTLAELARGTGRATVGISGNLVLSRDRGFDRGLDHYDVFRLGGAADVVDRFIAWYRSRQDELRRGPGFFAWLQPVDPHEPYVPDRRHRTAIAPRPDEERIRERWQRLAGGTDAFPLAPDGLPFDRATAEMRRASHLYDGEVRTADAAIGRLLEFLAAESVLDDTLVVIASDHGEMLYEHPRYAEEVLSVLRGSNGGLKNGVKDLFARGHGRSFQEQILRTPLILAGPGFPSGRRVGGLAANLDLYPTIAAVLGVDAPAHARGASLLGGARPERERVFAYGFGGRSVVDARGFKLIDRRDALPDDEEWRRTGLLDDRAVELFLLADDPDELSNLAPTHAKEVEFFETTIERWRAENRRSVDTHLSDEDERALREMGYVGDGG